MLPTSLAAGNFVGSRQLRWQQATSLPATWTSCSSWSGPWVLVVQPISLPVLFLSSFEFSSQLGTLVQIG